MVSESPVAKKKKKRKIQTQPKKVPKLNEFVKVDSENDDKEDEPLL